MKADIIMVNWNSGCYLTECIESVSAYGNDTLEMVVVVVNGSTDSSLAIDGSGSFSKSSAPARTSASRRLAISGEAHPVSCTVRRNGTHKERCVRA